MKILFTPAGDTDPVRGYHDGAMLHILRHYPVDKVIVFLTKEMEDKEHSFSCYSKGIEAVVGDCPKEFIESHITTPQDFEALNVLIEAFDRAYKEYPEAQWLLNISSATPQIKTVMTLLALDYERATAIHVDTPEKSSNRKNHACETAEELVEMLECNEDNDPSAPNRCSEPPLSLLHRHGLKLQIASLVENYYYDGALQLVKANPLLFTKTTQQLLQHGVYRVNLRWHAANKEIAQYKGKTLIPQGSDFSEYFQIMELRQRKGQLADFIVKLSPVMVDMGKKYLEKIPCFSLNACGWENANGEFKVSRSNIEKYDAQLLAFIEGQLSGSGVLRNGSLYFWLILSICQYLGSHKLKGNTVHQQITDIFYKLRRVEETARNDLAHTITNMTDEKLILIQKITQKNENGNSYALEKMTQKQRQQLLKDKTCQGLSSKEIVQCLHQAVKLIRGNDIPWSYDQLNDCILDSLEEVPK